MTASAPCSDLRLLFITQELDADSTNLGVAHTWVRHLAAKVAAVDVVAARTGRVELPSNVALHSLSRRRRAGRLARFVSLTERCRELIGRGRANAVLAHMVPAYALAAAPWARLRRAPLVLWYTSHGRSKPLLLAHRLVNAGATASSESYPLRGGNAYVLGHGIDAERFTPLAERRPSSAPPVVGAAGRVTPLKGLHVVMRAIAAVHAAGDLRPRLRVAGEPFYPADHAYRDELERLASSLGIGASVEFVGGLPATEMPEFYRSLDLLVNWRARPALDKVGLEALACGTPLVTNNRAYSDLLGPLANDFLTGDSVDDQARAIESVLGLHPRLRVAAIERLRRLTLQRHGADGLTSRFVDLFEALRAGRPPSFEEAAGADAAP